MGEVMQTQTIAISATFTADLLEAPLAFWMQEVRLPSRVALAPYNQVFQQLLDPGSLLGRNARGVNVVLVRLEDWHRPGGGSAASVREKVRQTAEELVAALLTAAERSGAAYLVGLCSTSPRLAEDPEWG